MAGLVEARHVLSQYFGYEDFRDGQQEAVSAALAGCDVLAVMPTGAGKSICYQIPAVLFEGTTLVVSPLISLMEDQVRALEIAGITAICINSRLDAFARERAYEVLASGACKILYIAPERLDDDAFVQALNAVDVAAFVVDEAHCVSQWGQDFRPSYLRIKEFIEALSARPAVLAYTATATQKVRADIVRLLGLHDPTEVVTGFDRPNLKFQVERVEGAYKTQRVLDIVKGFADESGIIYCSTRDATDGLYEALSREGISAARYHAGMEMWERERSQRAFTSDDASVMVATNAFGMGIDKSNVRYVIHNNMPGSLEAYYQEAGRAGRDGELAECILLWNDGDMATARFFIEADINNEEMSAEEMEIRRAARRRMLAAMSGYCLTAGCLRRYILDYFGQESDVACDVVVGGNAISRTSCGNCSNCLGGFDVVDVTDEARAVMRCVQELRGRFGKGIVADVLRGSASEGVRSRNLDACTSYGTLTATSSHIKEVIELMTSYGYLDITEGRYPLVGFGPHFREVAAPDFTLMMKKVSRKSRTRSQAIGISAPEECDVDQDLFERLRILRKQIADESDMPPYIVFSNATLRDMCALRPHDKDEFSCVKGVGEKKLELYADAFLAVINDASADGVAG